jgi:hypothetical protein
MDTEGTGELINRSEGTTKETNRSAFEVERSAFASARWLAASRIEPQIARMVADNEPSELRAPRNTRKARKPAAAVQHAD